MGEPEAILILGDHAVLLARLAERIRELGFRAVRAKTPEHAVTLAEERGFRFRAALVEPDLACHDLGAALRELRARVGRSQLEFLAIGSRPDDADTRRLREAGITRALWDPVGDHALLFQLNAALGDDGRGVLRGEPRAPTDWSTRYFVGGRTKRGGVYSLSGGGAYVATTSPSLRGAELALELPLPGGDVSVLGQVIYTNVPGNLRRHQLPDGMGLRFLDTPECDRAMIAQSVADAVARYVV